MSDDFEIQVTILGRERTTESNYGPRTERDTLARINMPVEVTRLRSRVADLTDALEEITDEHRPDTRSSEVIARRALAKS